MTERTLSAVTSPFEQPAELDDRPEPPVRVPPAYGSGDSTPEAVDSETLYQFEGKNVHMTTATITSVADLEINDAILHTDEYVRLVVECRVVNVNHKVDPKTGKLKRSHTLKAVDSKITPWEQ